mmetsp:Transcript_6491/g.17368  ORF Transcript_6491/g.17368 Transcript_6491/m.17368 type:complete len:316 (-) Transcript_6491:731-1678(-)
MRARARETRKGSRCTSYAMSDKLSLRKKKQNNAHIHLTRLERTRNEFTGMYRSRKVSIAQHLDGVQAAVQRLSNCVDHKSNLSQLLVVENVAAVEQKAWFAHAFIDFLEIQILELVPFSRNRNGMRSGAGFSRGTSDAHPLLQLDQVHAASLCEIHPDLLGVNLGVVNGDRGMLFDELLADVNRSRLASVSCVLLECETEQRDALSGHGVVHPMNDTANKSALLQVVHFHDPVEILGNICQTHGLAEVHQIENVLLKARSAKANRRFQKLRSNARIHTNGAGHLVNVCARCLADCRYSVDGRNALCKERVGDKLA